MEAHQDGRLLRTVERHLGRGDERALAENFLLFGLLAEIFMRANGFNGGMGGSMHAFFPPFGAYPNNAIVGGSAGIATGAALFKQLGGTGGIAVANIGDGATGCGQVWEAMNFASMAQLERLWPEAHQGGLPVLFAFNNNFYAMGGQTIGETAGWDRLSRIGAGDQPCRHARRDGRRHQPAGGRRGGRPQARAPGRGKGAGAARHRVLPDLGAFHDRRQCLPLA